MNCNLFYKTSFQWDLVWLSKLFWTHEIHDLSRGYRKSIFQYLFSISTSLFFFNTTKLHHNETFAIFPPCGFYLQAILRVKKKMRSKIKAKGKIAWLFANLTTFTKIAFALPFNSPNFPLFFLSIFFFIQFYQPRSWSELNKLLFQNVSRRVCLKVWKENFNNRHKIMFTSYRSHKSRFLVRKKWHVKVND